MIKFLIQLLLVLVSAFILELILPWWSIAIAAFLICALMPGSVGRGFWAGFLGILFLWSGSAFLIQADTGSTLHALVGQLMPGRISGESVIFITGLVGGLVGGFAGAAGASLRAILVPKKV